MKGSRKIEIKHWLYVDCYLLERIYRGAKAPKIVADKFVTYANSKLENKHLTVEIPYENSMLLPRGSHRLLIGRDLEFGEIVEFKPNL